MKNKIKVIVVDDEVIAREILESYISKRQDLELCGSFNGGVEALQYLDRHTVDLVFLDIHMPDIDGFATKDLLTEKVKVIFTTAFREYALKGFEVDALDYMLKPISYERFLKGIKKYKAANVNTDIAHLKTSEFLFVRADRKMQKVNLSDILYIESMSDYIKIYTVRDCIITRETIKNIEIKLPKQRFLRCHRSYIVALDKMDAYTNEHIEINGTTLPISRSYKADVLSFLECL